MASGMHQKAYLHPTHRTLGEDPFPRGVNQVPRVVLSKVLAQTPLQDHLDNTPRDRAEKFLLDHQMHTPVDNWRVVHRVFLLKDFTLIYPMLGFKALQESQGNEVM